MAYVSPKNEYPRHAGDIMLDSPGWKIGDSLPDGWIEVAQAPRPEPGANEVVYEEFPIKIDGVMTQNWAVRALTGAEIERRDLSKIAIEKLAQSGLNQAEIDQILFEANI
jgi:hypothetical protein